MIERPLMYWAVIEHHRWWIAGDRIGLRLTAGNHDGRSVRSIAKAYSVSRGILKFDDEEDSGAKELAERLNALAARWPKTLTDRAASCIELAEEASKDSELLRKLTRGRLVSAMTKLMWFIRPEQWSMFDRYAADGLDIGPSQDSSKRAREFYTRLDDRDFVRFCDQGNAVICSRGGLPLLYTERVLDKHLMLCAYDSKRRKDVIASLEFYLEGYPASYRSEIEALAESLVSTLGPNPLKVEHPEGRLD